MSGLHALIRDHRTLAIFLVALALFVKVLVPQGFMLGGSQKLLAVQLCLDGISHQTVQIAIPTDGKSQGDGSGHHGKADSPCAFTSLSMASTTGVDAPLLAKALAFILALGFSPVHLVLRGQISRLRPPLRGPPAAA
jgi:hypothetical protein